MTFGQMVTMTQPMISRIILPVLVFALSFLLAPDTHAQQIEPLSATEQQDINQFRKQAEAYKNQGDISEAARFLNKIAYLYWEHGYDQEAIDYFSQSLTLNEKIGNVNGITTINNNIGMIYSDLEDYDRALEYIKKALELRRKHHQKDGVAASLINIGVIYGNAQRQDMAIDYLDQALVLARELNDEALMRTCYGLLSEAYQKSGNAEKSIYYFKFYSSLEKDLQEKEIKHHDEENRRRVQEMELRTRLAEAEKRAKELELSTRTGQLHTTEEALHVLETAKEKTDRLAREQKLQIEMLNKQKAYDELHLKEQETRLRNEALVRNSLIGGFMLSFLVVFVMYRNYRQKKRANAQLAEQNWEILQQKEEIMQQRDNMQEQQKQLEHAFTEIINVNSKITGSINYAKRIQAAMLPAEEEFNRLLPEAFILFKPRDIVSGDYYWFTEAEFRPVFAPQRGQSDQPEGLFNRMASDKILITAGDCTGHGVPGALLTMIGFNLLNEIVSGRDITEADIILNELHKSIRKSLKQDETENRDGMDMAMCVINKSRQTLDFAGAKNPMVYIQDNEQGKPELHYIKGDIHPVGGLQKEETRIFRKHTISISEPTTVYIFSDGYADQFGGKDGRKFTIKRLKEILLEIHQKPMQEQKVILDNLIENWKGSANKQLDDILVMGFRIGGRN